LNYFLLLVLLFFNGAFTHPCTYPKFSPALNSSKINPVDVYNSAIQLQDTLPVDTFNIRVALTINDTLLDLYLLIGQSNMAGRGTMDDQYVRAGNSTILMLTKNNQWVPAQHPLHFDKPAVAGVGPGLVFGKAMAAANPTHVIGLIPCAVGGTSINTWVPGGYDSATKTHPYNNMLLRLKAAMQSGKLKGICWLQGESDSSPEKADGYLAKLSILIEKLRNEAGANVPFVAGQLGRYKKQYKTINRQLKKLPATVSNTAVASSKGLVHKGDNTHFNSYSAEKIGKRMANKMKRLQRRS